MPSATRMGDQGPRSKANRTPSTTEPLTGDASTGKPQSRHTSSLRVGGLPVNGFAHADLISGLSRTEPRLPPVPPFFGCGSFRIRYRFEVEKCGQSTPERRSAGKPLSVMDNEFLLLLQLAFTVWMLA